MAGGPLVHALTFPNATSVPGTPASGETVLYVASGVLRVKDDAGVVVELGVAFADSPPSSPGFAKLWVDTTSFALSVWDDDNSVWVELGGSGGGGGDPTLGGDLTGTASAAAIAAGVIVDADVNASAAIAVSKLALVAGAALGLTTNTLNVLVDDTTIEVNTDALRLKAGGVTSSHIADGTIVNGDINASAAIAVSKTALVAGAGLGLSTDTLAVNVDDVTIEINTDTLRAKAGGISNSHINAAAAIAVSKLALVAGAALTLTGDTLDVAVDGVGIEVSADALRLKDGGVTSAKIADGTIVNGDINASAAIAVSKTALVAGNGLALSTDTLAVNVDAATIEINADTLRVKDAGIGVTKLSATGTPSGTTFLRGDNTWATPGGASLPDAFNIYMAQNFR